MKLAQFLTIQNLAALFGQSRRTIRRWIVQGRLPPPLRWTKRTHRWCRRDMLNHVEHGPYPPGWYTPTPRR